MSIGEDNVENTTAYRRELAAFLRSRRERLAPAVVGIPALDGPRRTPGLRRSEVAQRAGISVTWYTWLEQGRRIRVSPQVLASLARALLLDRAETEHLFELAGELTPAQAETLAEPYDGPEACARLLAQLDPLPAVIHSRCWDIIRANDAFTGLVTFTTRPPHRRQNLLALMFEPEAKELFVDWSREASNAVAKFRALVGRNVVDPKVAGVVDRLTGSRAEFRALWHQHKVVADPITTHRLNHPLLGRVELASVSLSLVGTDETLVVYLPARSASVSLAALLTTPLPGGLTMSSEAREAVLV